MASMEEHLYEYASDKFKEHETGRQEQEMASEYIKKEYISLGIPAAKSDGEYHQNVPLEVEKLPTGTIRLNGTEYMLGEDVLSFSAAEGSFWKCNLCWVWY